ncbi:hypothetical protein B0E46_15785 [Rhodanobacter sp. B04]|uniref:hypothetical protein n=1 Tax=Rhodanobacter sp. B04 TaxID=1945860 RepID=UPI0009857176|nr:hypothetical protein [Rhodanobacter sp. B04]OOG61437.1 hypothetical protein B0E46_15785 [Rhodanobacter sp. B04]
MNDGISIREFSRREHVSDTLVHRAIKQGRLRLNEDKKLDPKLVGSPWREGNAVGGKPAPKAANTVQQVFAPKAISPLAANIDVPLDESLEDAAERLLKSGAVRMLPYGEALQNKENYLALLRQLEFEQKSGELIELSMAERVLFEGARAQRDAWLNWPARVGAMIAADLGLEADRVTEILTTHVHKHIEQLGEPDVDFRSE